MYLNRLLDNYGNATIHLSNDHSYFFHFNIDVYYPYVNYGIISHTKGQGS
jgi:hypothetical protein